MNLVPSSDLFLRPRQADEIISEAMSHKPRAIFVGFSGGDDSLVAAHWMMNNVPGCQVFHCNTGIGIEATRRFMRETCAHYGWPLHEIRAKEDCGQDYREFVLKYGFPGPAMHRRMYDRLKGRAVEMLVRQHKQKRRDRILLATGIHHEESMIRMGYGDRNINFVGSQMWVNPLYWWPKSRFSQYIAEHGLRRNPVAEMLGMSAECLCGAYAHKGEKAMIRVVCPETADYIDLLEREVLAAGHAWGWEDRPPREPPPIEAALGPLCRGCEKTPSRNLFSELPSVKTK